MEHGVWNMPASSTLERKEGAWNKYGICKYREAFGKFLEALEILLEDRGILLEDRGILLE